MPPRAGCTVFIKRIFCELNAQGSATGEPECEHRLGQTRCVQARGGSATEDDAEAPRQLLFDVRAGENMRPIAEGEDGSTLLCRGGKDDSSCRGRGDATKPVWRRIMEQRRRPRDEFG
jgi:hypothetical protein